VSVTIVRQYVFVLMLTHMFLIVNSSDPTASQQSCTGNGPAVVLLTPQEVTITHPVAPEDGWERRIDPADGNAYTRAEFVEFYGVGADLVNISHQWDEARPAPPPPIVTPSTVRAWLAGVTGDCPALQNVPCISSTVPFPGRFYCEWSDASNAGSTPPFVMGPFAGNSTPPVRGDSMWSYFFDCPILDWEKIISTTGPQAMPIPEQRLMRLAVKHYVPLGSDHTYSSHATSLTWKGEWDGDLITYHLSHTATGTTLSAPESDQPMDPPEDPPEFVLIAGIDAGTGAMGDGSRCGQSNYCISSDYDNDHCSFDACKAACLADSSCAGIAYRSYGNALATKRICRLCPPAGSESLSNPIPEKNWGVYMRGREAEWL
jgi:hypothetical protein